MIEAVHAVENTVEIKLAEPQMKASTWIGEEQTLFELFLYISALK